MDKYAAVRESENNKDSLISTDDKHDNIIMNSHSKNQICENADDKQTSTVPSFMEVKNVNTCKKAGPVISCVIALATTVLAINLVLISLGWSKAINSNSAIQSLTTEIKNIHLTLNQTQIVTLRSNSDIQSLTAEMRNLQLQLNKSQIVTLKSNFDIQSLAAEVKNIHLTLNQSQITAINSISDIEFLTDSVQSLAAEVKNILLTLNQSQISAINFKYEIQSTEAQVKNIHLQLNQTQITAIKSTSDIDSLMDFVNHTQLSLKRSVINFEALHHQLFDLQAYTATQYGILNKTLNSLHDTILEHSDFINKLPLKGTVQHPYRSCGEIPTDRPSGEYWIMGNYSKAKVYCDMNTTCCNTAGKWMRVASLDMTDTKQQCPDGYRLHIENTPPLHTCKREAPNGCVSTTFPVHGIEYSRVCGRVIGYQFGEGHAFDPFLLDQSLTIDDPFFFGFSLTHGQLPRKHIWTFVASMDESDLQISRYRCPCSRSTIYHNAFIPSFVGHDYFCDTGSTNRRQSILYRDDPLWNGKGCGALNICCSFNNPPFFCRQLPQPTTDNIELRGCFLENEYVKNVYLELIDIFVQ